MAKMCVIILVFTILRVFTCVALFIICLLYLVVDEVNNRRCDDILAMAMAMMMMMLWSIQCNRRYGWAFHSGIKHTAAQYVNRAYFSLLVRLYFVFVSFVLVHSWDASNFSIHRHTAQAIGSNRNQMRERKSSFRWWWWLSIFRSMMRLTIVFLYTITINFLWQRIRTWHRSTCTHTHILTHSIHSKQFNSCWNFRINQTIYCLPSFIHFTLVPSIFVLLKCLTSVHALFQTDWVHQMGDSGKEFST